MLKDLLDTKKCIKIICGAGNEDLKVIADLVLIYVTAGYRYFDLSANLDVVKLVKNIFRQQGIEGYICVSYGIAGDPHIKKINVNSLCTHCGICVNRCDQSVFSLIDNKLTTKISRCIGCGQCIEHCQFDALSLVDSPKSIEETLPDIVKEGIDTVELHISGVSHETAFNKWKKIMSIYDGTLSVCIDRGKNSDEDLKEILTKFVEFRKPYTTIIQADGLPMSGMCEKASATLQALAIAQIVNRMKLPAYLTLSGGTNGRTLQYAKNFDIDYNGVSLGSYARKIIKNQEFILAVKTAIDLRNFLLGDMK